MKKSGIQKASKWELFGFSFNNASTNAVFIALSTYFLIYCTEIYGMSPVTVGLIMTGTRLFDAFTDPLIGILIDKTNTRFGRFRPWILAGSLICATNFVLMFSGIQTGSDVGNIVLVIVLYSIFVLGYTMQTACTKSAQTILTQEKGQRTIINSLGMTWTIVVYALIVGGALPIIERSGGNQEVAGWRLVATIIACIQLLFAVCVIISLGKKDTQAYYATLQAKSSDQPKFRDYIDIFTHNRALQMLIVAASTNKIAQTLQSGMMVVFFFYVVQNPALQGQIPIVIMLLTVIAVFASIRIITKVGRVEMFKYSSIAGFAYGFCMIPLIAMNPSNSLWLICVLGLNAMLIIGTNDQNLISMIADAADYEYYTNNRFILGMIGTTFSFIDKIVSSLSSTLIGVILSAAGFVSITETPWSSTMFWTVLVAYCAVPALGHLFSIIGMHYHPLKKDAHEAMIKELSARRAAVANTQVAE